MTFGNLNVENLLRLAEDRSAESRKDLAVVFKDLFEDNSLVLNDREKNLMFKIAETLFKEVELSICSELSEALSKRDDVPQTLVSYLANHDISVAAPFLSRSVLLQDEELITIIRHRTSEYQMAITLRREISEEISEALVEAGDEDVIISLLENNNSKISDSTLNYLVEQSRRLDTFQEPLIHREDLKSEMVAKLYSWVSDALRQDIASKFDLPRELIDKYLNVPEKTKPSKEGSQDGTISNATYVLIKQLKDKDMVTPEVMLRSLVQGEIPLFVGLFVEMTGLDVNFAQRIIFDGHGEEIAVSCRAIGVTEMQLLSIINKTRKRSGPGRSTTSTEDNNRLLSFYRALSPGKARKTLDAWIAYRNDRKKAETG